MWEYSSDSCQSVQGLMLKKEVPLEAMRPLPPDFSENLALLGLDERAPQKAFASLVEKRLADDQQVHLIQAQAGIGKTYGYLLPLLAASQEPLMVSVPSLVLQQQIMEKEGKSLVDGFGLSLQSLKSSRHFLKLDSFWRTLQRDDPNRLLNRHKMQILVWLCDTETGDLDELKFKMRYQPYFDELQHDGSLEPHSLFADWDFWRRLHRRARQSRLLLTNHAYLLHHLKDQAYLTENRILVIDEAQKLLLTAESLASQSLPIQPLLQDLQSGKDKSEDLLEQRLYESSFFELQQLVLNYQYQGQSELTSQDLEQLQQNLQELDVLEGRLQDLSGFLDFYDHFWLEEDPADGESLYHLRASQLDLLDLAALLPQTKTFCISATLSISKRVNLADLLGFEDFTMDELPSRRSQQQEIFLLEDLPDLVELDLAEQAAFLADFVEECLVLYQPILLLFTSKALLAALSSLLDEKGLGHLAQYRDGSEMVVKKRFERGESQLLLATGAFWEGVDFASQEQVIQVIPRLPFDNPRDSLVKKINHVLRAEGKQPFYDYNLPVMLLKLKQAIGRTKRHDGQVSAVILLDNRCQNKRYSRQIKRFLKDEYQVSQTSLADLSEKVAAFFSRHS